MVKRTIIETDRQSYVFKFAYLKDNREILFHPFRFFLENWGDTCGLWCVGGHCRKTFANVGFRWNLMRALNASRSCDQCWDVQCVVDGPMSYTRWDWQDSGPHQRDAEEEAKGLWVTWSMGFNSSTGLNAEASAYMMSQNKAKQEPKWGCLCIPACGEQQWRGEKRGTWEVYSSTWRPFFFQWSLPDSSPSVKTPTKWENTPQFDYLGREGVPLTNINGGRKVLNRHKKIRAGFHCTPWAAPRTWCWQSLCQQQIQLKDGAGRDFLGVWFLLLSQQLWPKLFAIKQQVAASQESLLAHTRYVLATCSGKASIPLGTSVSQAAQRAPALHGVSSLQGKLGVWGSIRQADHCLLGRWLEDLERSCRTSVSPAQTLSFCPGISSQCKKRCEPFLCDVKALAAGLEQ